MIDVSPMLCLTVTCYKVKSGWGWRLDHLLDGAFPETRRQACLYPHSLSALSHALGLHSKPTTLMTSQLRNPQEKHRGRLDSGKTQAKIRLLKV